MRQFKTSSIGLDIGARCIKLVELKKSGDSIVLNKFGIKEIPADVKTDREKVILQAISQLFSENNIKTRKVNICAGGQSVFVRFVKLLQAKEDKIIQTMKFEAQNQIPFPLNEVAWDWALLDKDKSTSTKKAVIVAIKRNLVEGMALQLNTLRLSTDLIDVSPMTLYNCLAFNEDYDEGKLSVLIDIGAKTSDLVIFKNTNIWMRSFPVACDRIEEAKGQGIEELIGEIERSIEYYFMQSGEEMQSEKKIDELILTGGGSVIEDVEIKLASRFGITPKIMDPFRKLRISKDIFSKTQEKGVKNQLSIAIGLALRGLTELKIEVNFLKGILSEGYLLRQKNLYSRLSIVMAILAAVSFSIFIRQSYSVKKLKLNKIGEILELYTTYEPKIKELKEKEDILKERKDALYHVAGSRDLWLDVFKVISGMLSEEIWITDISGIVSLEKDGVGRMDLSGKALSYQSVNNFVSALKSSPRFKDVKPISSSMETDLDTGEEIVKFSITMDIVIKEKG